MPGRPVAIRHGCARRGAAVPYQGHSGAAAFGRCAGGLEAGTPRVGRRRLADARPAALRGLAHALSTLIFGAVAGCAEWPGWPFFTTGDPLTAVLAATVSNTPEDSTSDDPSEGGEAGATDAGELRFSGSVRGSSEYRIFALGASEAGDHWSISLGGGLLAGPFVTALFDEDDNLLMRAVISGTQTLEHTMRAGTGQAYLAVSPGTSSGGRFELRAARRSDQAVPEARRQVVYLRFDAARDVRVHRRGNIDFEAFDAAMLGESYVGQTRRIKDFIVQAMRDDYAEYDIALLSSDEAPAPEEEHATIYFGGLDPGLLGLADSVDSYNGDPGQRAIVYVGSFAIYEVMELTPEQMGVMISNVASHELGHLLGLYHTRDPVDVMDTTGGAWDLATDQSFARAELEATVFPIGMENSPVLLWQTLGANPDGKLAARQKPTRMPAYEAARRLARREIRHACGTCLNLDD